MQQKNTHQSIWTLASCVHFRTRVCLIRPPAWESRRDSPFSKLAEKALTTGIPATSG
ncbi:hypothetical protein N658DRAFT_493076 [Parathielavia hyrcaniae]|uniref:Uncharacterized protein n=1 Tax=Parathielavia hyrcaniae TaxID=113614 RepID=A0AAN6QA09_9PEZI|nr:hypothetical protein N658DRAFT_493076 [Parathielavia hyrcaniae]